MQDPFVEGSLDTVRVRHDLGEVMRMLQAGATGAKGGPLYAEVAAAAGDARAKSGVLSVVVS